MKRENLDSAAVALACVIAVAALAVASITKVDVSRQQPVAISRAILAEALVADTNGVLISHADVVLQNGASLSNAAQRSELNVVETNDYAGAVWGPAKWIVGPTGEAPYLFFSNDEWTIEEPGAFRDNLGLGSAATNDASAFAAATHAHSHVTNSTWATYWLGSGPVTNSGTRFGLNADGPWSKSATGVPAPSNLLTMAESDERYGWMDIRLGAGYMSGPTLTQDSSIGNAILKFPDSAAWAYFGLSPAPSGSTNLQVETLWSTDAGETNAAQQIFFSKMNSTTGTVGSAIGLVQGNANTTTNTATGNGAYAICVTNNIAWGPSQTPSLRQNILFQRTNGDTSVTNIWLLRARYRWQ